MSRSFKIAFQLYSARNTADQDSVLSTLSTIGYESVEAWPPNYEDPASFGAKLKDTGLTCMGIHTPFTELVNNPEHYCDIANEIGAQPILIPSFLPPNERPNDVDGWREIGKKLSRCAERVQSRGLQIAWHNHEFEFRLLPDGSRPIDYLLSDDEERVGFEIDLAWVARGWADPAAELSRFAKRITSIQIKDTARPGTLDDQNGWRAAGDGILDWHALWPLFAGTAANYLVVEHDKPVDWKETAQRSYDFARRSFR